MTIEQQRVRRFDLAMDLNHVAKMMNFAGISAGFWKWTERAGMAELEELRRERWNRAYPTEVRP